MAAQGSPTVSRHRLRLALRRKREATGRTQSDIAKSLDWSLSKLQRIEAGENSISTTDLQALLGQLKVIDPGLIGTLLADAKVARRRSRWDSPPYRDNLTPATKMLLDFEQAARTIRTFQVTTIPGVLQTREFATALFEGLANELTPEERAVRLEVRMQRHGHVFDRFDAPTYMLILDESLLYRALGGPRVFTEQLRRIMLDVRAGLVKLRIAPFALASAATVNSPFTVLTMEDDDDSILYRENSGFDEIIQLQEKVRNQLDIFAQLWQQSYSEEASDRLIEARSTELLP